MNIWYLKVEGVPSTPYLGFFFLGFRFKLGIPGSPGHHAREVPVKSLHPFTAPE